MVGLWLLVAPKEELEAPTGNENRSGTSDTISTPTQRNGSHHVKQEEDEKEEIHRKKHQSRLSLAPAKQSSSASQTLMRVGSVPCW
jgi:hypothetical protein